MNTKNTLDIFPYCSGDFRWQMNCPNNFSLWLSIKEKSLPLLDIPLFLTAKMAENGCFSMHNLFFPAV